jgi:hypothetical protein
MVLSIAYVYYIKACVLITDVVLCINCGRLDDRVRDAAIIDGGKHPYVLVFFTKDMSGDYDADVGHRVFADITKATTKAIF